VKKSKDYAALCVCFAVCIVVAGLGSVPITRVGSDWYVAPSWAPPSWAFGPVWTVLYGLMAVAAWRVWRAPQPSERALSLFGVQLGLNLLWPWVFFGARNPGAGFVEIVMLWCAIAATIEAFRRTDRLAAALMLPYIAWVTYAAAVNLAIFL
jgi:tryptophan-rich sensory protein